MTGGAGFIGSNIVRKLVSDGKSVRVLDNLATGRLNNISDLLEKVNFIEGDIRDKDTAKMAVEGVGNVLHLAALPSVVRSIEDPIASDDVNVCGTLVMLQASVAAGVERFVLSSSSSVYGDTRVLPKQEDMVALPLSPYAVQKLACEHYCGIFYKLYGLKTFALRYFNVFGPRQNPASHYAAVIPLFAKALMSGNAPVIHGDGLQTRDFTFVEDVVSANIACCTAAKKAAGGVYNVACGSRTSILELAKLLAKIIGKDISPVHDDSRPGDVRDSQGDASRAQAMLGWCPKVGLEEGLRATVEYFGQE